MGMEVENEKNKTYYMLEIGICYGRRKTKAKSEGLGMSKSGGLVGGGLLFNKIIVYLTGKMNFEKDVRS